MGDQAKEVCLGDALKTHIGYATVIPGQIVEGVEAIEMVDRQFGDFRGIVHHLEVYCPLSSALFVALQHLVVG